MGHVHGHGVVRPGVEGGSGGAEAAGFLLGGAHHGELHRQRLVPEQLQRVQDGGEAGPVIQRGGADVVLAHAEGRGAPRDDALSAAWMYLASNWGDPDGAYELGLRYAEGRGIDQDAEQALHCLSAAAARGHAGAKEHLAKISN